MVMYQQLVSVQLSYCRGIKKTGQSWRCTANLPCRVGEHFTWKKKVLYSCRDRQDGSPVESVPCLAEPQRGQGSQMLRRQGSVESASSRWIYQHGHAASIPVWLEARVHMCVDMALLCVSICDCAGWQQLMAPWDIPVAGIHFPNAPCVPVSTSSGKSRAVFLHLSLRQREGRKSCANAGFPSPSPQF